VWKVIKEHCLCDHWNCQSNSASPSVTEFWTLAKTPVIINDESIIHIVFALLVMMKAFASVQKLSCTDKITAFVRST